MIGISLGLYSLEERIDLDVAEGRRSPAQAAQAKIMAQAYKQGLASEASAGVPLGRTAAEVDAEGRPYLVTDQRGYAISQGTLTAWEQQYLANFDAGVHAPGGKADFLAAIDYNRGLVRQWDAQAYEAIDGSVIGFSRFGVSTAIAPLGLADVAYSLYSGEITMADLAVGGGAGLVATIALRKPIGAITAKFGAAESGSAKFVSQGFNPAQAEYLAAPYPANAMGHHFIPRRSGLPSLISDSPLNVLKPSGISRGDFYELHYKVDPYFFNANFPKAIGGTWRGSSLGFEKYGAIGRVWYGSPTPLKVTVGGVAAAGAGTAYYLGERE